MRQRLFILITIAVVIGVLVVLNAASYVREEEGPDTEWNPNRSTYNSGPTGTLALYDFLRRSGREVVRWRDAPASLLEGGNSVKPATFVVVGRTLVNFDAEEAETLLHWVERGGRLVIVDRRADARLLPPSGKWQVSTELQFYLSQNTNSDSADELVAGTPAAHATQPTVLTRSVDEAQPSRYAALIKISSVKEDKPQQTAAQASPAKDETVADENYEDDEESGNGPGVEPPPPRVVVKEPAPQSQSVSPAPVVHLASERGALLVDYAHGKGRIIVLSDPFIIANNGINRADNLRLALNIVAGPSGLIAFDEYHQGHAATHNALIQYFAGTPVLAMFAQTLLIVLTALWTNGSRFARPLPVARVDRRSSLEFVASMAELQQRARAYDLAIENIYTRTRRVLARFAGLNNNSPRTAIAARVAARSALDREQLETLMRNCENAINGEPISAQKSLELIARLREVERTLGLRMRSREIRQAKER
ncbi:MAG: DUF4350 domain-containing protein [Pyrinomonadaceae bacterium]